jgi:lipoprotein-releasing system ATP-binding protein
MSDRVLAARALAKTYLSGAGRIDVLRDLDLDLTRGEAVAVVGDSGVGKSTLLHVLGGLDRPDAGVVLFEGTDIHAGGTRGVSDYRNRHVGFIFQFHYLLPEFSALENVEMPFRIGRRPERARDASRSLLERLGLGARLDHRPAALSGGEQQRVAVARAVAPRPAVILADEPTGNLDPATGASVFRLLRELQREEGFALVVATQSERLARGSDRVLRLEDGKLRPLGVAEARAYFDGTGQTPTRDL